jgi:hypothetical protein
MNPEDRTRLEEFRQFRKEVPDVNYYFPSATIIIPGSPLPPKPTPHPPAAVSLPAFRPVLCV